MIKFQVCFKGMKESEKWYIDSGCSKHMTGEKDKFSKITMKDGGYVKFGDKGKGKIIGNGTIGTKSCIEDVSLVEGLKYNLLSVSQLCDKGFEVKFTSSLCTINNLDNDTLFIANRSNNVYLLDMNNFETNHGTCLVSLDNSSYLWHKRLGHASMHTLSKLSKKELVNGLPKINYENEFQCRACALGKHTRASFKSKNIVSTTRPLELFHLDLFGPVTPTSLGGKSYALVIVDDYSRYTWTFFLTHKDETFEKFTSFSKMVQNEKGFCISSIVVSP